MSRHHDYPDALHSFRAAADRLMLTFLGVHLLLTLGVAAYTDTWLLGVAVGLPALLVPGALVSLSPGSVLSRSTIAAALMVFSALTIQQFGGAIEAHFGVFVLLAFLLYYRLIHRIGPARAATVTYLVPLFGAGFAWAFLGEPVTLAMLAAGVLILGSVAASQRAT